MSDDASRFDPRFDPAFQRGYDGPAPTAPPRLVQRSRRTEVPPEPIGLPPRSPHSYQQQTTPQAREPLAESEPLELVEEDVPRGINPLLVALAFIGIVLVLAGIGFLANIVNILERANTGGSQYEFYFVQSILWGAPMLICLGIATLLGVLFVLAARWKR